MKQTERLWRDEEKMTKFTGRNHSIDPWIWRMCDKYVFFPYFLFIRLANAYVEQTFYAWPFEKCFYGMKNEFPLHHTGLLLRLFMHLSELEMRTEVIKWINFYGEYIRMEWTNYTSNIYDIWFLFHEWRKFFLMQVVDFNKNEWAMGKYEK